MTVGELKKILIDVPDDADVVYSDECGDTFDVTQIVRVIGLFGTSNDKLVMSTD